jgi:hypothetical protein
MLTATSQDTAHLQKQRNSAIEEMTWWSDAEPGPALGRTSRGWGHAVGAAAIAKAPFGYWSNAATVHPKLHL